MEELETKKCIKLDFLVFFLYISVCKSLRSCLFSYYASYAFEIMSHHASYMTLTLIKMMQISKDSA